MKSWKIADLRHSSKRVRAGCASVTAVLVTAISAFALLATSSSPAWAQSGPSRNFRVNVPRTMCRDLCEISYQATAADPTARIGAGGGNCECRCETGYVWSGSGEASRCVNPTEVAEEAPAPGVEAPAERPNPAAASAPTTPPASGGAGAGGCPAGDAECQAYVQARQRSEEFNRRFESGDPSSITDAQTQQETTDSQLIARYERDHPCAGGAARAADGSCSGGAAGGATGGVAEGGATAPTPPSEPERAPASEPDLYAGATAEQIRDKSSRRQSERQRQADAQAAARESNAVQEEMAAYREGKSPEELAQDPRYAEMEGRLAESRARLAEVKERHPERQAELQEQQRDAKAREEAKAAQTEREAAEEAQAAKRPSFEGVAGQIEMACRRDCIANGGESDYFRDPDNRERWLEGMPPVIPPAKDASVRERNIRNACTQSCRQVANSRHKNRESNTSGQYTGRNDGCGQSELILAAASWERQFSGTKCSRADFFSCLNQNRVTSAQCTADCSSIRTHMSPSCNVTKAAAQAAEMSNQVAKQAQVFGETVRGQDAVANVEEAQQRVLLGDSTVDVQQEALRSSARALDGSADQRGVTAMQQGIVGILLTAQGGQHIAHGDNLSNAAQEMGSGGGRVRVGADSKGDTIYGSGAALVGSAGGAIDSEDGVNDAEARGADAAARTADSHKQVGQQTMLQGIMMMTEAAQNAAQAVIYKEQANRLRAGADGLHGAPGQNSELPPGSDWNTDVAVAPPVIGNWNTDTPVEGGGPATEDPSTGDELAGDMQLPDPLGGGGGQPGGLSGAPSAPSAMVARNAGSAVGGGGSAASAEGLGASSSGGPSAGDAGGDSMAGGGQASNSWSSSGGAAGGYAAAGGARGKHDTGMDFNALVAQLMGKKDDGKAAGAKSILDYGKSGARGPASDGDENDGSILGRNSNLFLRISTTTQQYYRTGRLR